MIGEHIRTVEFVICREENKILFIEAKSSSLQERTSKERYDEFITEIVEKFVQSFEIYHTLRYNRYHTDKGMGEHLKQQEWDKVEIKLKLSLCWLYTDMKKNTYFYVFKKEGIEYIKNRKMINNLPVFSCNDKLLW